MHLLVCNVIHRRCFGSSAPLLKRLRLKLQPRILDEYRDKHSTRDKTEDSTDTRVRITRNLLRILGRDAEAEGVPVKDDGSVRVSDLFQHPTLKSLDLKGLETIAKQDKQQRFNLYQDNSAGDESWCVGIRRGIGLETADLDLQRIEKDAAPPLAVHGTTETAWKRIVSEGLSRMARKHIHLAQSIADYGVLRNMQSLPRILIYVDVGKAVLDDIPFFESEDGIIFTPGNKHGFLEPKYFKKVEQITEYTSRMAGWKPVPPGHPFLKETMREFDDLDDEDSEVQASQYRGRGRFSPRSDRSRVDLV